MTFVILPIALVRICTGKYEDATEIIEAPATSRIRVAMQRYGRGNIPLPLRMRLDDELPGKSTPSGGGEFASFQEAMAGLKAAFFGGYLPVYVANADGIHRPLDSASLKDLEIGIPETGHASCGLEPGVQGGRPQERDRLTGTLRQSWTPESCGRVKIASLFE